MTLWYLSKKTDFYANLIDYSIRLLCPCHVLCGWCPACRGSRYTGGQCSSKPPGAYDVGDTSSFGVLQWRPPVSVLSLHSVHCATWGEFHSKTPNTPDMSWWLSLSYHCKSHTPHPQLVPSEVLSSPVPLQHKEQICPGLIQKHCILPDLQLEPRILPDLQLEPRILPDLQLEPRILLDLQLEPRILLDLQLEPRILILELVFWSARASYSSGSAAGASYSSRSAAGASYSSRSAARASYSSGSAARASYSSGSAAGASYSSRSAAGASYSSGSAAGASYSSGSAARASYSSGSVPHEEFCLHRGQLFSCRSWRQTEHTHESCSSAICMKNKELGVKGTLQTV